MTAFKSAIIALAVSSSPAFANEDIDLAPALSFIEQNNLDSNLYNLLGTTIPNSEAGQMLFKACGPMKTELVFEKAYIAIQGQLGEAWRTALATVYTQNLSADEMAALTAIEDRSRETKIAERLTQPEVVSDLEEELLPLLTEATARQLNHMIEDADTRCIK